MKTVLTKLLVISGAGLLMLASCKKAGVEVVSNGGKPGALTANTTTLPLEKAMVNDTTKVIVFNFTKANYGFAAGITNTLEIDAAGDNWANPTSFTLPAGTYSQSFDTFDFNNLVLKLNLAAGVASQVNVRIAHVIGANVPAVYSNVLSLTVTPFNLTSWVYVPGAYEGWSFPGTNADSLISVTGNGIYTGIINFTAGNNQFLIVPTQSWANKWATADNATSSATDATYSTEYVSSGGNNFYAPSTPGYYLVTFNSNTNQLTIQQADFYSIIGSAPPGTAWQNDYPMKYLNDGSGNWVANNVPMVVGEYKFRQDNQWTNSWGPTNTAGTITDSSPTGDGNIQLTTAGNYNFTFYMPATVLGTTPSVTTTYTATKQ